MDMTEALNAAAGQTVQPGDFNVGTQRTTPSAPLASGSGSGSGPAPAPQPAAAQPGSPGGPAPAPAGGQPGAARPGSPAGGQPQPRPAAPFAGQQPASGQAVSPPGQPAAGAAASTPWSLRQVAQELGFDPAQMADDQAAWNQISGRLAQWNQSVQQNAQLAQYGQFYLANKAKFDAMLQQGATPQQAAGAIQQGQQAAAADPMKNLFKAPDFNPEWLKQVSFDPQTGKAVVPMGYDPGIGPKVDNYVAWRREAFEKFLQDPMAMLREGIVPLIQQEAQKLAQQQVGGYADQQFAVSYVNSQPWMFQKDNAGNQVQDPTTGQPLLTPLGLKFRQYVSVAERQGIRDVRQQASWATAMVERDAALWQLQQMQGGGNPTPAAGGGTPAAGTPAATNAEQQAAALRMNGARRIAGGGGQAAPNQPATPAAPKRPMGRGALRNRLAGALQQAGIN
jgi:hypothetical protein